MRKIHNWIIGAYLEKTENVFDRAKIELLYNFALFYLINLFLFYGVLLANHYYYHAAIITFTILMVASVLFSLKKGKDYRFIAKILFVQQIITGIVSYLIQESGMDFVGEFWIVVNILITFFTLGKNYGFIMTGVWLIQLAHCLANDLSGGKFILIDIPKSQVLPPAPQFILVPFFLCIYIIYQFVKTRAVAERDIQSQKKLIEDKNKEITDSINYAKRIQQAKLPDKQEIFASFPNCFVLYKPKDIVSGDFYYLYKKDSLVFIAAADCTGHGVPGAFMSMISSEKLDKALAQNTNTSEILKLVNTGIKSSLKQFESQESTRDGMDIALCSVNLPQRILNYAGANRPLWLIRKGENTIREIKATKKAIGGFTQDNQHFESHELKLREGDTFYLFTDGYADTFNGRSGKKLMTTKFKEILVSIQDKSLNEQEQYLNTFIEDWKAGEEQVDDILVIGVRL